MSSASSSTLPSPAELENLGVLFIGFVIATVFYGLTFFQTYIYYSRYPKDYRWIRYLVCILYAPLVHRCPLSHALSRLYYYLIVLFNVNMEVLYATTTFCVSMRCSRHSLRFNSFQSISRFSTCYRSFSRLFHISSLPIVLFRVCLISQYFLNRSRQVLTIFIVVTGGSRVVALALACTAKTLGIRLSADAGHRCDKSSYGSYDRLDRICDDVLLATPSEIPGDGGTVVRVLVCRGLAFTVAQTGYFCVFIAAPSRQLWIPMQMVASKLYVNTLLGCLNSRDVKHGQGLNEEDPHADHRAPPNGQLSNSVRLNVSSAKAMTQSVVFTTGHNDNQSQGTESKKTYQDEQGNEYAQVSTGSSQSRTDSEVNKESLSEQV
ncbi:hypothetical protein J3R82DRAFT_10053 [Butyriboletus roseoflavus]|nr:hypothetical protein J3R82DRAFT_10053 [Butyriboletus roseoflavus]